MAQKNQSIQAQVFTKACDLPGAVWMCWDVFWGICWAGTQANQSMQQALVSLPCGNQRIPKISKRMRTENPSSQVLNHSTVTYDMMSPIGPSLVQQGLVDSRQSNGSQHIAPGLACPWAPRGPSPSSQYDYPANNMFFLRGRIGYPLVMANIAMV